MYHVSQGDGIKLSFEGLEKLENNKLPTEKI
jgi:hypothetical protein